MHDHALLCRGSGRSAAHDRGNVRITVVFRNVTGLCARQRHRKRCYGQEGRHSGTEGNADPEAAKWRGENFGGDRILEALQDSHLNERGAGFWKCLSSYIIDLQPASDWIHQSIRGSKHQAKMNFMRA
eukprot:scaffold436_cov267-Pinguiococcus_pyrenoidosus.AAC.17